MDLLLEFYTASSVEHKATSKLAHLIASNSPTPSPVVTLINSKTMMESRSESESESYADSETESPSFSPSSDDFEDEKTSSPSLSFSDTEPEPEHVVPVESFQLTSFIQKYFLDRKDLIHDLSLFSTPQDVWTLFYVELPSSWKEKATKLFKDSLPLIACEAKEVCSSSSLLMNKPIGNSDTDLAVLQCLSKKIDRHFMFSSYSVLEDGFDQAHGADELWLKDQDAYLARTGGVFCRKTRMIQSRLKMTQELIRCQQAFQLSPKRFQEKYMFSDLSIIPYASFESILVDLVFAIVNVLKMPNVPLRLKHNVDFFLTRQKDALDDILSLLFNKDNENDPSSPIQLEDSPKSSKHRVPHNVTSIRLKRTRTNDAILFSFLSYGQSSSLSKKQKTDIQIQEEEPPTTPDSSLLHKIAKTQQEMLVILNNLQKKEDLTSKVEQLTQENHSLKQQFEHLLKEYLCLKQKVSAC